MLKNLNLILIFAFSLFFAKINAAHIIGGDVTYTCLDADPVSQSTTFRIIFTLYRDASGGGAAFDNPAAFGLYSSTDEVDWQFVQRIDQSTASIEDVDFSDPCVSFPPELSVEKGTYMLEVTLPWDDNVYKIAYQRCCRNNTINNIVDPGSTGAVYSIDFYQEAIQACNNSPVFNSFPPIIICLDEPIDYDSGATDVEGDELIYELCTPFTAGGTDGATTPGSPTSCTGVTPSPLMCLPPFDQIQFLSPLYNTLNPLGASANLNLDLNNGFLTGVPDALGQYVIGICVNEYRDGVLMSRVRRDFQFNIAECIMPESDSSFEICQGDSIVVNGVAYNTEGDFEQVLQTTEGCDSTVSIKVQLIESDTTLISRTFCEGESISINNETYAIEGSYIQVLENSNGCDSVLQIELIEIPIITEMLYVQICEGTSIDINGVSYSTSGSYEQVLEASNGCDSILNILIEELITQETVLNYSLCKVNEIVINDITYDEIGQYAQVLTDANGCDSTIIINVADCAGEIIYDFELCNSFGVDQAMDYSEFIPSYNFNSFCGSITASNVFRENAAENKHSCTEGNNSSITMCISALDTCDWDSDSDKAIVVELSLDALDTGSIVGLSNFSFYHRSPLEFDWIMGAEGINNYPQMFNVKVFRDGTLIYEEGDLNTSDDWTLKSINFNGFADFVCNGPAMFRVEITPYCLVGNASEVAAWDVDDFNFTFSCFESETRSIAGRVMDFSKINEPLTLIAIDLSDQSSSETVTDMEGSFRFDDLHTDHDYIIDVNYSSKVLDRISDNDIRLIKDHILGLKAFSNNHQYYAADANNDQRISMTDVNLLRRLLVGIDSQLKWNTPWRFYESKQLNSQDLPDWNALNLHIKNSARNINDLEIVPIKIGDVDGLE